MARVNRHDVLDLDVSNVCLITTKYVRGLYLCGKGKSDEPDRSYRRNKLEVRIAEYFKHFAMSLLGQGIMSNHLHLQLVTLPQLAKSWSPEEVIRRACHVFEYTFRRKGVKNCSPTAAQLERLTADTHLVETMRNRLRDPSWFMRQLLWRLSWESNREDDVEGHFVDGRFDLRLVVDDVGIVMSNLYIDLNQTAAMEVDRPELSLHTSAGLRIAGKLLRDQGRLAEAAAVDGHLAPISKYGDQQDYPTAGSVDARRVRDTGFVDLSLESYLTMLDTWGRQKREGKRGQIPSDLPPILDRLGTCAEFMQYALDNFDDVFTFGVGSANSLAQMSEKLDGRWSGQVDAIHELEQLLRAAGPRPDS